MEAEAKSFQLVGGDKNSKYFHSRATQRHCRNKILGIFNSSNLQCTNTEDVVAVLTGFYHNLFSTSNPVLDADSLSPSNVIVNVDMNEQHSLDLMEWEVQTVLKKMSSLKLLAWTVCLLSFTKTIGLLLVMILHNLFFHTLTLHFSLNF